MPLKEVRTHHYVLFHEENIVRAGLVSFPQRVQNVPATRNRRDMRAGLKQLRRRQIRVPDVSHFFRAIVVAGVDKNPNVEATSFLRLTQFFQCQS